MSATRQYPLPPCAASNAGCCVVGVRKNQTAEQSKFVDPLAISIKLYETMNQKFFDDATRKNIGEVLNINVWSIISKTWMNVIATALRNTVDAGTVRHYIAVVYVLPTCGSIVITHDDVEYQIAPYQIIEMWNDLAPLFVKEFAAKFHDPVDEHHQFRMTTAIGMFKEMLEHDKQCCQLIFRIPYV